jgi:hypothetical protein
MPFQRRQRGGHLPAAANVNDQDVGLVCRGVRQAGQVAGAAAARAHAAVGEGGLEFAVERVDDEDLGNH